MAGEDQQILFPYRQPADVASMEPQSRVLEALTAILTEEQTSDKAPPGLDRALENVSQNHISQTFLKAGFYAWYAYFLAIERNEIKTFVAHLSRPSLEHVAFEISKITPHQTVVQRIQHILHSANRASKRARILSTIGVSLPSAPDASSTEPSPRPPKRSRLESVQHSAARLPGSTDLGSHIFTTGVMTQEEGSPDAQPQIGTSQPGLTPRVVHSADCNIANELTTSEISQYEWPKAENLPYVFPHYMCTAIYKEADKASIKLSFPADPTKCCLVIGISATEVQNIARELFGVYIRDARMRRCVVLTNGTTIDIHRSVNLRGAATTGIDTLFGKLVEDGFRHSYPRMEEFSMGEMLSGCSSMEIWAQVESPAQLKFMVEAKFLTMIYQQLWQS